MNQEVLKEFEEDENIDIFKIISWIMENRDILYIIIIIILFIMLIVYNKDIDMCREIMKNSSNRLLLQSP